MRLVLIGFQSSSGEINLKCNFFSPFHDSKDEWINLVKAWVYLTFPDTDIYIYVYTHRQILIKGLSD